jgi:uncharacterized membrane protein YesL
MGLLFGNYDTPGPGVPKDAPPLKPVPRFFSILQRKFFDLIKLNLLFCIPVAVVAVICYFLNTIIPVLVIDLFPLVLLSPFCAGLTFVTRNYAREEHAFIFSDFMDAVKQNWKQFLLNGLLLYIFISVMTIAISYYHNLSNQNIFGTIATVICIVMTYIVICSQYYVPVLIVTFDLKLFQIIKNSLIFAIVGLLRNFITTLLLIILVLVYIFATVMPLTIIIMVCFTLFLLFSYCSFLINFAVYPLVDKMMIQPYLKMQKESKEGNDEQGEENKEEDDIESDFVDRV